MLGIASAGASAVGSLVGIVGGFAKNAEGKRMQRKAEQDLAAFKWKDLSNPYKDLQVSTLGSDYLMEQADKMAASSVEAIRSGGQRGIAAGMGAVNQRVIDVGRSAAINLDEQQKAINNLAAGDEVRIRQMEENRQANELAGIGQMMNVGLGMKHQGIANIAQGFSAMGSSMGNLNESLEQIKLNKVTAANGGSNS